MAPFSQRLEPPGKSGRFTVSQPRRHNEPQAHAGELYNTFSDTVLSHIFEGSNPITQRHLGIFDLISSASLVLPLRSSCLMNSSHGGILLQYRAGPVYIPPPGPVYRRPTGPEIGSASCRE